jgi:hypothetical protein
MSYSQEKFESYFCKMDDFQKIAARNGFALKELLIKKVGLDEELADALVKQWGNKKGSPTGLSAAGGGAAKELFESYLSDMGSFQKLADVQGVPLRDWLTEKCGLDGETAAALIKQWGPQALNKSTSLLELSPDFRISAEEPNKEKPASSDTTPVEEAAAKNAGRKRAGEDSENDMVFTISAPAEESAPAPAPPIEVNDLDWQIDKLHSLADLSGNKEPHHLIAELKAFGFKKYYLANPVAHEDKNNAERLISLRDEQNKKISRLEKNLIETKGALSLLRENPPKLFGRDEHRQKIQAAEAAIKKMENEISLLNTKKSETQNEYSKALALIEKHAQGKREIDRLYKIDEEKFKQAKDVIIQALYWSLLDIPEDVSAGLFMENIQWYTSFFKTFPEKIDFPLQGWLKAYNIAYKVTFDYPEWREEIENIHFVIENDMKSLKDLIRIFLNAFVDNLKELFQSVCQLCVSRSEAEKTQGRTLLELANQMENELNNTFDHAIIEFCTSVLPSFYTIHALAELLNFEAGLKNFFENMKHTERFSLQDKTARDVQKKTFYALAEASSRVLTVCFKASEEVLALGHHVSLGYGIAACKNSIRADFEKYYKSSEHTLNRFLC